MPEKYSHITRAVAGIIRREEDGAVFMQQRRAPQSFDGFWEFPGGKVNPGEDIRAALRRELREETGVVARKIRHFVRRQHRHPGGEVLLDFFDIAAHDGIPQGREGQNCRWAMLDSLPHPQLPANAAVCKWLRLPPVCAITAAEIFGEKEMLRRLQIALSENRFRFVQLRDKTLSATRRADFAMRAADLCRTFGALFCVNDDESLAEKVGGGLHLSGRRLAECKSRPASLEWVGASCHSAEEILRAAMLDLDFAFLSPIKKTKSHSAAAVLGWRRFAKIAAESGVPIYALGGMRFADAETARRHNACGIAMMRNAWGWK